MYLSGRGRGGGGGVVLYRLAFNGRQEGADGSKPLEGSSRHGSKPYPSQEGLDKGVSLWLLSEEVLKFYSGVHLQPVTI